MENNQVFTAKYIQGYASVDELIDLNFEGYSFLKVSNIEIAHKYVAPVRHIPHPSEKNKRNKAVKRVSRMIEGQFNFHSDTSQLLRNIHLIKPGDVISISDKWHGTSAIYSNCLVKRKLLLKDKIAKFFGVQIIENEYDSIYASRTVIKNGSLDSGYYGEDIWGSSGKENFEGKLYQGETVYFEIVGFLKSGQAIQKKYDYGCQPFQHKIAVYRITQTTTDSHVIELGWAAMKERCKELQVPTVEELYFGRAKDLFPELSIAEHWNQEFAKKLQEKYFNRPDKYCKNKVVAEGVVIRIESRNLRVFKLKDPKFVLSESLVYEEGADDIEEQEAAKVEN